MEEGYSSMVILKSKNPKTQEVTTLPPFKLPPSHKHLAIKPTALEARHFAATYALFRVCSMRNIHMMLPPDYRDLWKGEFEVLKKEDVKGGNGWMYEGDPFAALRERDEAKALMEKKKKEREQEKAKAVNTPGAPGSAGLALRGNGNESAAGAHNINRGWTRIPKIEMGKRARAVVEDLIRKHAIWNPHEVKLSEFQRHSIVKEFKALEFRQSHVEEAVEICKDREETLEWLLIHVPEDDLPKWALPEGYVAGISMASQDLKKEAALKRLAEAGYSHDLVKQIYDSCDDEDKAASELQLILMSSGLEAPIPDDTESWASEDAKEVSESIWLEEQSGLQSVFGDNYSSPSKNVCRIGFKPANRGRNPLVEPIVQFRRTAEYPQKVPVISIHAAIPAYIRLSVVKKAINNAIENYLGEQMLFFIIDWVEQNFYNILENPGRLRDISAASSTVSEIQPIRRKKQYVSRHPKPLTWSPNPKSKESWMKRQGDTKLQIKIAARKTLPAWEMRETIVDMVNSHQVTIISGETGSGKSTQSAQFILDDLYQRALGESTRIM